MRHASAPCSYSRDTCSLHRSTVCRATDSRINQTPARPYPYVLCASVGLSPLVRVLGGAHVVRAFATNGHGADGLDKRILSVYNPAVHAEE